MPDAHAVLLACGYRMLPATAEQIHRLTQQRRIFGLQGEQVLAERPDGFLETWGTLTVMLEQHAWARDLATGRGDAGSSREEKVAAGDCLGSAQDTGKKAFDAPRSAREALIAEFESKAAVLGLSVSHVMQDRAAASGRDVAGQGKGKGTGPRSAVRYRGPNGQEWSGRGRPPSWITRHEAAGGRREEFLIG